MFLVKNFQSIERYHTELLSFGAGLMVDIFFLEILPHIAISEGYLGSYIYGLSWPDS